MISLQEAPATFVTFSSGAPAIVTGHHPTQVLYCLNFFEKQPQGCSIEVSKIHQCWSLFFSYVAGLRHETLLKKDFDIDAFL